MTDVPFGPNGQVVYERTYSRPLPNGEQETYPDTVMRVARGNIALVYGDDESLWPEHVKRELAELEAHMLAFKIIPAGRHLWATGTKGRQYLFNCWTSGWDGELSQHFEFTFLRLMEGGGVGANYSSHFLERFGAPRRMLNVHIVCDPSHPDYEEMRAAGVLSDEFTSDWDGAYLVEDSREGWASALTDLIDTYMTDDEVKHEARVYDVSNVRHKGARLKTFGGTASGPQPFAVMMHKVQDVLDEEEWSARNSPGHFIRPLSAMAIDHAIAECVVSGGVRRSARMSIVRWDDPHIFDFIESKSNSGEHWTTNISVEVDDAFFEALADGDKHARQVHEAVVYGMKQNGEPGYWNSSLSNVGEIEEVFATNPCGEITLQPYEACCLGHVNLNAFAPESADEPFKYGGMLRAHQLMARFLIRATFADMNDPKSIEIQHKNRRIGVGHLGVQDFLVKNGWRYSEVASDPLSTGYTVFRTMLSTLYKTTRRAARDYAFELRIPEPVKVTTVAPTGSVSKLPGVGGEGIHPIYARYFEQRIRFNKNDVAQAAQVEDARAKGFAVEVDGYDASGNTLVVVYPSKNRLVEEVELMGYSADIVEQANEISLRDMLAFQAMYQAYYADNAVSFTVNIDPDSITEEQIVDELIEWLPQLKGTTIMPDGSRPQAPFTRITEQQYLAALNGDSSDELLSDGIDMDCSTGACPIR